MTANFRYFADLSSNNAAAGAASFNAAEYAAAGHVLIGIKVTESTGYINPFWREWAAAAHKAHVSLLLYHFAQAGDAAAQARFFAAELAASGLYLSRYDAIALDNEPDAAGHPLVGTDPAGFRATFETRTRILGLRNLVSYSTLGMFAEYGRAMAPAQGDRLWVADINPGPLPAGWWGNPWARQYTWNASVAGISTPCDLSVLAPVPAWWRRVHRP